MPLLILATSTDLNRWAATRAAQERLPELIRRLVFATTDAPAHVDFPSGDAVQLEGYDGAVELTEDHPVVPQGLSVWEMGTDQKVKGKADDDYQKRTAALPPTARGPVVPSDTTFVFVTPRRWGTKAKWAAGRRAENVWKDVRVLDAVDLEAWLILAPATHVWLSRVMNLTPAGATDLETTWADWSEGTTPTTSTALVLASREKEVTALVEWLHTSGGGALTVSAGSVDNALGVVAAAVMALPDETRTPLLARTVVVTSADAFIQLAASTEPLILVVKYAAGTEVQRAARAGHRVVIPTGPVPGRASSNQIIVPRVRRHDVETALVAMKLSTQRARDLAGVARRSMLTLRRRLATTPALETPAWAAPLEGPALVPMLLLGQFDESKDADLQALSALLTADLNTTRRTLQRWSQEVDPPVRRVGNVWYLVSKEDAWDMLSGYVSPQDLTRFAEVAKNVLGEVHPKFDLPAEDRWVASIHGKERQYSGTIASGVADTIALLGALDSSVTLQGGVSPSSVANRIVRDLFDAIAGDWRGWATLSPVLPLLAEGAPDAFMQAVETQIASDPEAIKTLFGDAGDIMFSSSTHTGILWALETLAWSPDHLAHSARLLAALDRSDPGGHITNRPGNSLRSIFLGWLPQTSADLETRLAVLAELRRREPEAAWRLFAALLPRNHDQSSHNPRPSWRDWVAEGAGEGATYHDIFRQTSVLVGWMVADAGGDPSRWVTLLEALPNVGPNEFDAITAALSTMLPHDVTDAFRAPVADALRGILSRHRSFEDAQWALPAERLAQLEPLLDAATPHNPVPRHRWLFSNHPELPEGREDDDFDAYRKLVEQRQGDAVEEIYRAVGTEGLVALAAEVERPDELGRHLASRALLDAADEVTLLNAILSAADHPSLAFGRGFSHGWTIRIGAPAALAQVQDAAAAWTDETRGRLLLSHDPSRATLDVVDGLSAEGQRAYWLSMQPFWLDPDQVERGLRALLKHGRSHAVIDAAAMHLRKQPSLDAQLLAEALEHAPTQRADPDGRQMTADDIGSVLDALERAVTERRIEESAVARLEFLYLGILGHFTRPPRILHRAMAKDASMFVDAVRLAYRARGTEPPQLSPDELRLAERAHRLLDTWREPPGWANGTLDPEAMNAWVDAAREQLKAISREEIGDQLIGMVMSGAPNDVDRAWPLIPIRDLMERISSEHFETGLRIGRYNGRGVITRDPLGGGSLERSEAEGYEAMATVTATRWPRTAALLRFMAQQARTEAAHEDEESDLWEDLEE